MSEAPIFHDDDLDPAPKPWEVGRSGEPTDIIPRIRERMRQARTAATEALPAQQTTPEQRAQYRDYYTKPILGSLSLADIAVGDPDLSIPKDERPVDRYDLACHRLCSALGTNACTMHDDKATRQACVEERFL